jgi:hypothetical protein
MEDAMRLQLRCHSDIETLVAVNTSDREQLVSFWFPLGGDYVEELQGGDLDLKGSSVPGVRATIPSHYGRI